MSNLAFCNYCSCETCKEGDFYLSHALTANNDWICDVCYKYELCLDSGAEDYCKGECNHRPQIIGKWEGFKDYEQKLKNTGD